MSGGYNEQSQSFCTGVNLSGFGPNDTNVFISPRGTSNTIPDTDEELAEKIRILEEIVSILESQNKVVCRVQECDSEVKSDK